MLCSGLIIQRSTDKCASRAEHQGPEGIRRTEYEEQIGDLELFIPEERKCRGHMDGCLQVPEYFRGKKGGGICVFQDARTGYT